MAAPRPIPTPRGVPNMSGNSSYGNVALSGSRFPQPAYTNTHIGSPVSAVALTSTRSDVNAVSSFVDSRSTDPVKQMEREIHVLTMNLNDKDAQLDRVQRDLGYSHDQIKQLNVLLAEKKESILQYQERISDLQSDVARLRDYNTRNEPLPDLTTAHQANEALKLQLSQLRAQLTDVNQQNTELRTQNRDLLWQVQKAHQQQQRAQLPPPLRASTSNGSSSQEVQGLRAQNAEVVRDNTLLRSRVELLTHQVTTYNEDFKAERSDRERAQATILEKNEEISGLKQMVILMAKDNGIQLDTYGLGHLLQQYQ